MLSSTVVNDYTLLLKCKNTGKTVYQCTKITDGMWLLQDYLTSKVIGRFSSAELKTAATKLYLYSL